MKEFELQGDISSGFRWRVTGEAEPKKEVCRTMETESEEPPYIPLKRQPSGTATAFDLDYDLLLASEREARRQLLAPWAMLPLTFLKKHGPEKFADPYVAHELHCQELRDRELRDVLDALFGKAADWRIALCINAWRNDHALVELGHAIAIQDGTREVDRFLEAFKAVDRLKKNGPVKTAKAWALLFVLGCRVCGERMPTKGATLRFLESKRIAFVKEHAARDIFTGPILSALLRGRAGRPRKTRRAQRK